MTTDKIFQLGRRRPVARGRALHLKNYLMRSYAPPPASVDWTPKAMPSIDEVYLNDALGDCVIAWGAHMEGILTGNATGTPIIYTYGQIKQQYSAIGGYVDGNPSTDNGCDEEVALNYWQQNGFAGGTKIAGWMRVDGTDPTEVRAAIDLFGTVTFGVELPAPWVRKMPTSSGFVWDVAGDPDPDNGHCFGGGGYEPGRIKIVEWGLWGWITDAAVAKYATTAGQGELYTVLSEDWISKATTKAPNAFDWSQLQADIESFK